MMGVVKLGSNKWCDEYCLSLRSCLWSEVDSVCVNGKVLMANNNNKLLVMIVDSC